MQPHTSSAKRSGKRPSDTFDRRPQPLKCARPAGALRASHNRQRAFRLRLKGHTFRQIAAKLGVRPSTAHAYVQVAWEKLNAQTDKLRRQLRQQELARLDKLHEHYWPIATKDNLRPLDPAQGPDGPVVINKKDFEEQLHAIEQVLKISTQRCLLLGLIPYTESGSEDEPEAPVLDPSAAKRS